MVTANQQPPSKEELKQLSPLALSIYVARAALRVSVFLCTDHSLAQIWRTDTPRHSAGLLGVWVLLRHVWGDASAPNVKKNKLFIAATRAARAASYAASYASYAAARAAYASADASDTAAADTAAAYAARAATDTDADAARADYVFLIKADPETETAIWSQIPLWQAFNTKKIQSLQQRYLQNLSDLGLGFLQDDARYAWGLTGSEAPSPKYLKALEQRLHNFKQLWQLSETEHLDTAALKRILGDGTHAQGTGLTSLNAVRVVLVGPGGAGKTALNHLLHTGQPLTQSSPASLAIDYKSIPDRQLQRLLNLAEEQTVDQLKLSTWDFAGQTLFYGLHQAFLHENCVYVLVVDNRHEQAPDAWLAQIDYVLREQGAESRRSVPVLIVTNEYEGLTTKQNQNRLIREYPHLLSQNSFFYFSCLASSGLASSGYDYRCFIRTLLRECLNSRHTVLAETLQAMEAIQKKFKDGELVLAYEGGLLPILEAALTDAGRAVEAVRDIDSLQKTLEGLGVIIPIGESSIIDPSKVVSTAYRLLSSSALKECFGLVDSLAKLGQVYTAAVPQSEEKHRIALEHLRLFLEGREVCITLKTHKYIFPDALTEQEHPDVAAVHNMSDGGKNHFRLRMHYDLDFLPFGLNGKLIQAAFKQCPKGWCKTERLWRDGFMLQNDSAQAVLQLNKHKTRIDLTLRGDSKDDNAFSKFKSLLKAINTRVCEAIDKRQRVTPFIEIDDQLIALSPANLNMLLNHVHQFDNLVARIKEMSQGNTQNTTVNFNATGSQVSFGDNSPNTQNNITFTPGQEQDWKHILAAFSQTKAAQNLNAVQDKRLEDLIQSSNKSGKINNLAESEKSIVKKILEGVPTALGVAADTAAIAGFYAANVAWINPLLLSILTP